MVPQDSFLFSTTLAENIAFGCPRRDRGARRARRRSARSSRRTSTELPDGYDTVVGERGVMLSGGQRQRTALARALALDPSILILDDTLSSVDAETEAAIQRELADVFRGRTVVVVALARLRGARRRPDRRARRRAASSSRARTRSWSRRGGLYARLAAGAGARGSIATRARRRRSGA